MTGGKSWRRTPIKQQKWTPPNKQGGVGRHQQGEEGEEGEGEEEEEEEKGRRRRREKEGNDGKEGEKTGRREMRRLYNYI